MLQQRKEIYLANRNRGKLPGKHIPEHFALVCRTGRIATGLIGNITDGAGFFVGDHGKGGKADHQQEGKKEPLV